MTDTPTRSRAYFDQFVDREMLEAALEQAENDVVTICKDLAVARKELAEVRTREAGLRELLGQALRGFDGVSKYAPWTVTVLQEKIEAALAGGDNRDGYVIVPKEPTAEMCDAPLKAMPEHSNWLNGRASYFVWEAMIAARPGE